MSAERVTVRHVDSLPYVRAWLTKPPKGVDALRLLVREGDGPGATMTVLGEWERADIRPALATDIINAVDAHVAASESDVLAHLQYMKAGEVKQTRAIRRHAEREDGDPPKLGGSYAEQAALAQRHLEKMADKYARGIEAMTQQVTRLCEAQGNIVESLSVRLAATEFELHKARRELSRVPTADGEGGSIDAEQQQQLMGLLMQFAPLLLGGGAGGAAQKAVQVTEAAQKGDAAGVVAAVVTPAPAAGSGGS